ncbi:MAG TPA: hypothetical protein VKU40_12570 [Thermoanaerobaculia bacterium]|nr:hypothetical protein [Thermoanaerobaculia bacterium]
MRDDFIQQVGRVWEPLWQQPVRSHEVIEARQQLHWAVALLAAVAAAEAEPQADHAHLASSWDARRRRFVGRRTRGGLRATLQPATLRLGVEGGAEGAQAFSLTGRTPAAALNWLTAQVEAASGERPRLILDRTGLPGHRLGDGAAFSPPGPAHVELVRWYAGAVRLLDAVRADHRGASPVRLWPHHFDVATQLPYGGGGAEARSIAVGMQPGDGWHPEPYFYVLPWPPPSGRPQRLGSGGFWNTEGWVGAALVAHRLNDRPPERQGTQVAAFVQTAIAVCEELIGVVPKAVRA